MKYTADLHLHSPYSRAVSKEMTLENLDRWAQIKGIDVIGTADFTHPDWFNNLTEKLEEAEDGLYKLKDPADQRTRFLLTSEISLIYSSNGKGRRVHHLVFMPSLETVERLNRHLSKLGHLYSDGRPILGIDSKELLETVLEIESSALLIPAHAWTPWFSVFGSNSGFDSLEECFGGLTKYIYAIETGLSSDPAMNWRLSKLDNISLVSFSDAHSLSRLGREATIFDGELSFNDISKAIKREDGKKIRSTIEFFPEEGKYHYDGHRNCQVCFDPEQTKQNNYLCPVCNRSLTVGVLHRIDKLADRPAGFKNTSAPSFVNAIPLAQIISDVLGSGEATKAVDNEYQRLIEAGSNELKVLFDLTEEQLKETTKPEIAQAIIRVRNGNVHIEPGYDGEYGKIKVLSEFDKQQLSSQPSLF